MRQPWQLARFDRRYGHCLALRSVRPSLRPLPLLASAFGFCTGGGRRAWRAASKTRTRSEHRAAGRGLIAEPVRAFHPKSPGLLETPVERERAVVRARRGDDPADIYVVETRVAPGGSLLSSTPSST